MIGWTTRNVISREKDVLLNIFKSIVRPHLEQCTQLWNPVAKKGNWKIIMEIEKVQRDFTRLVENFGILPYKDRLKKLGLTTLLERRLRGNLIETFKIVTGKTKYGSNLFNMSRNGINLLFASSMQSSKCDFITNRVVNYWNKLPVLLRKSEIVQ